MSHKKGIMQGRLVPPVKDAIQAFPAENWRQEFSLSHLAGLQTIEWIYDKENAGMNPIATDDGIHQIMKLSGDTRVRVESLCADYFMDETLLQGTREERRTRETKLHWLLGQCKKAGISRIILPFVDNSRIATDTMAVELAALLRNTRFCARESSVEIHLETSLGPARFVSLLETIGDDFIKVNYDTGNSASLGYDVEEEFSAYGAFVGSIHIKDRIAGGTTVPLGTGNVNFRKFVSCLERIDYKGDFILQVARGDCGKELEWAVQNRNFLDKILAGEN
jgi:hexulose-6-phosphate isomerase